VLYIHCFAGRGRTGLVAACLLGALYDGVDADEALERVSAYYKARAPKPRAGGGPGVRATSSGARAAGLGCERLARASQSAPVRVSQTERGCEPGSL
jgi:hypothetical protein